MWYHVVVQNQSINNDVLTTPLESPALVQSTVGHGANMYSYTPCKLGELSGILCRLEEERKHIMIALWKNQLKNQLKG